MPSLRIAAAAVVLLLASGCSNPLGQEASAIQEAVESEEIRFFVPTGVPHGYELWSVSTLSGRDGKVTGASSSWAGPMTSTGEPGLVVLSATTDPSHNGCGPDAIHRDVWRDDESVTVCVDCASQSCEDDASSTWFSSKEWLDGFGDEVPPASDIPLMD